MGTKLCPMLMDFLSCSFNQLKGTFLEGLGAGADKAFPSVVHILRRTVNKFVLKWGIEPSIYVEVAFPFGSIQDALAGNRTPNHF